jgi:hypothetical protein
MFGSYPFTKVESAAWVVTATDHFLCEEPVDLYFGLAVVDADGEE